MANDKPMTTEEFEAMCDSPRNSKRNARSAKRAAKKERASKKVNHNFHDTAEMFDYYKKQNLPSSMR